MGLMGLIPFVLVGAMGAQVPVVTIEAGAAHVGSATRGISPAPAAFLAAQLLLPGTRWSWTAIASGALGAEASSSLTGGLTVAFTPMALLWSRTELGVNGGLTGAEQQTAGRTASIFARQWIDLGATSLWAGAAIGKTSRPQLLSSTNATVDLGATVTHGSVAAAASVQHWRTADWRLIEASGYYLTRAASAYTMDDARLQLAWQASPVALSLSAGWRLGTQATEGSSAAFAASARFALATDVALTLFAGDLLADPVRGAPEARLVSASVRWRVEANLTDRRPAGVHVRALVDADPAGGVLLIIDVAAAPGSRVEYAGSFTDWTPRPVPYDGARFLVRIPLVSGRHRVSVRVNGGSWLAPSGLARVDDELGGDAALVIVP